MEEINRNVVRSLFPGCSASTWLSIEFLQPINKTCDETCLCCVIQRANIKSINRAKFLLRKGREELRPNLTDEWRSFT